MIYGDGGDGYETFDLRGRSTGVFKDDATQFYDKFDGDVATAAHFANLIAAIRKGDKLHAPIPAGQHRCHHASTFEYHGGAEPGTAGST